MKWFRLPHKHKVLASWQFIKNHHTWCYSSGWQRKVNIDFSSCAQRSEWPYNFILFRQQETKPLPDYILIFFLKAKASFLEIKWDENPQQKNEITFLHLFEISHIRKKPNNTKNHLKTIIKSKYIAYVRNSW